MHPIANIRGSASSHLSGKRIVLAVSGSIAAVKTVELARELVRHGADVHAVMSDAACGIITPESLHFGTGNPVITKLSGGVEHVALLGDVPGQADALLIAPATANTVSKMALGIDDSVVTTCATVAFGTGVPVLVAPAMHEAMLEHPIVEEHAETLRTRLGVTWIEPAHEEKKAKLADIDVIVHALIKRLAQRPGRRGTRGPLAGKRCLVVGGATAEPVDPVRVLTNRASGKTGHILSLELERLGADVELWDGVTTEPCPTAITPTRFTTHAQLMDLVASTDLSAFDQVWMPAAINDYAAIEHGEKMASEGDASIPLRPLGKVIEAIHAAAPSSTIIAFKAESNAKELEARARSRMERYGASWIVANTDEAFGADATAVLLLARDGRTIPLEGPKQKVLRDVAHTVATDVPAAQVQA